MSSQARLGDTMFGSQWITKNPLFPVGDVASMRVCVYHCPQVSQCTPLVLTQSRVNVSSVAPVRVYSVVKAKIPRGPANVQIGKISQAARYASLPDVSTLHNAACMPSGCTR